MSYSAPLAGRRFSPGTFTPAPAPNTVARIVSTLSWLEFRLFVRNGEQIVVNLVIPVAALLILTLVPIGELGTHRATVVVPAVMAAAIVSSAFTGQSIAVGFDRRYGALKCVGSTIAPLWAIVVAKSVAVVLVVAGQLVLLGVLGVFLGWAPNSMSLFEFGICAVLGTACLAAMCGARRMRTWGTSSTSSSIAKAWFAPPLSISAGSWALAAGRSWWTGKRFVSARSPTNATAFRSN